MRMVTLATSAACIFAFSAALAAPFSTSDQNPSVARGSSIAAFQEHAGLKKCKQNVCTLQFHAIKNTQVLIQHVSCNFGLKTGGTLAAVELGNGAGDFDMLPSNKISGVFYTVTAQAYFFVNNGQNPDVTVFTQGKNAEALTCTISGQHVPESV